MTWVKVTQNIIDFQPFHKIYKELISSFLVIPLTDIIINYSLASNRIYCSEKEKRKKELQ